MRIALLSPPVVRQQTLSPPLGLAYLASFLRKSDHKVFVLDGFNLQYEEIVTRTKAFDPEIIGITSNTGTRHEAFRLAKLAKTEMPDSIIVAGGHHVTALPDQVLRNYPQIDFVVRGEGELAFDHLLRVIETGEDYDKVKGISFRKDGAISHNPDCELIEDLDSLPFPAIEDFDYAIYPQWEGMSPELRKLRRASMITSRGCPYNCLFCYGNFWKWRYRSRSAMNVVDEIEHLHSRNVRYIRFHDDCFALVKKRVLQICDELSRRKLDDLLWTCNVRADILDAELLSQMRTAGCHLINIGMESGSPEILRNIKKGITVEQIRSAFRIARQVGLEAEALIMIGNPGESRSTLDDTVRVLLDIRPDYVIVSPTMVMPGTELWEDYRKSTNDSIWLNENMTYPLYESKDIMEKVNAFGKFAYFVYSYHKHRYGLRSFLRSALFDVLRNPRELVTTDIPGSMTRLGARIVRSWNVRESSSGLSL